MSDRASFSRALTALRSSQSLLSLLHEPLGASLSPLRRQALMESALIQAYLSLLHYCRAEVSEEQKGQNSIKSMLLAADSNDRPQLVELQSLLFSDDRSASWLDYLLNHYELLVGAQAIPSTQPKRFEPSSQLIAVASESDFSDSVLQPDTLQLMLQALEQFLLRQQEHLHEW